ncbi:MAG: hypothetical protein KAT79_02445 [candidate division Zixibacteria bacterium]|nr:hypothetical protein [candidate division Zixibacteria bacterium]
MSKRNFEVRFGVKSADSRRSTIWRIWTPRQSKSDVYITAELMSASLKVSLHEGGTFQVSFNQEFVSKLNAGSGFSQKSRHIDRWTRTSNICQGVTLALRIFVPSSELRVLPLDDVSTKPIQWVEAAPVGRGVEFDIFLYEAKVEIGSWSCKDSNIPKMLRKHKLPNGETLAVVYHEPPVTQVHISAIESLKAQVAKVPPTYPQSEAIKPRRNMRLIAGMTERDDSRVLIEIAADTIFKCAE